MRPFSKLLTTEKLWTFLWTFRWRILNDQYLTYYPNKSYIIHLQLLIVKFAPKELLYEYFNKHLISIIFVGRQIYALFKIQS